MLVYFFRCFVYAHIEADFFFFLKDVIHILEPGLCSVHSPYHYIVGIFSDIKYSLTMWFAL